jgi:hypothetical protein
VNVESLTKLDQKYFEGDYVPEGEKIYHRSELDVHEPKKKNRIVTSTEKFTQITDAKVPQKSTEVAMVSVD